MNAIDILCCAFPMQFRKGGIEQDSDLTGCRFKKKKKKKRTIINNYISGNQSMDYIANNSIWMHVNGAVQEMF